LGWYLILPKRKIKLIWLFQGIKSEGTKIKGKKKYYENKVSILAQALTPHPTPHHVFFSLFNWIIYWCVDWDLKLIFFCNIFFIVISITKTHLAIYFVLSFTKNNPILLDDKD
jgi:hypothetical protein